MQTLEFRPMVLSDVDAVMRVEVACYPFPWTKGIFADCIRVGYDCWVAQQGSSLVGHGVLSAAAGESHILNLTVDRNRRQQGIGRHLLDHLIARARLQGAEVLMLEVRASNDAAIRLYESSGFNEIGSRKAYYPAAQGKEDALVFALQL